MEFFMPVRITGRPLRESGELLRACGKRCLIVTGSQGAEKAGALADALAAAEAAGVRATVFPGVPQNPDYVVCHTVADAADAAGAHSILAIGGGSVMDAAKAAAWIASNIVVDPKRFFAADLRREPLPLLLCATTAGTGSELTRTAVITDTDGHKRSVKAPQLYAKVAFSDPRYTDTLPRRETVVSALDALAHVTEGWFSPSCDSLSTLLANEALKRLAPGLLWLAEQDGLPDRALRDGLFYGAQYAGAVLDRQGTAFPHGMSNALHEQTGASHGEAVSWLLAPFLECAKAACPDRAADYFAHFGGEEQTFRMLGALVSPPPRLSEEQLELCAARWRELPHYARTPGGFSADRAEALAKKLFSGKGD